MKDFEDQDGRETGDEHQQRRECFMKGNVPKWNELEKDDDDDYDEENNNNTNAKDENNLRNDVGTDP